MPYQRILLAPRYALRLQDLQATDAIEINCQRQALVVTHRLHDRFPSYERITQICRQMRCRRCGSAGGMGWKIVRASPDER